MWNFGVGGYLFNDWLGNLWVYLGKNFFFEDELCRFEGFFLFLLDMLKVFIIFVRFKKLFDVVVRSFYGDFLDDVFVGVLKEFGVIVM